MKTSSRCIAALNRAAGREMTADEALDAFDRVQRLARDIAAGRAKVGDADISTPEGVIRKAADMAAQELIAEKARQLRNTEMRVAILGERQAEINAMRGGGIDDVDALRRLIVNDADGKANRFSLEARALGVSNLLKSRIQDTWAAMGEKFMGLVQDRAQMRDLIAEMKGKDTGNAVAKRGAEAWAKATDEARVWFNSKGGNVGRLDDWGFPQHHSQARVAQAGRDAWVADVYPLLDHGRYTDAAGRPANENQIKELLAYAWQSIATNGANKIEPGQAKGHGARANRHAEERQIHLRDADAVMAYWDKYGESTFPDILLGHMETMARDIAFIEHFGPNPDAAFRVLRDGAEQNAKLADPARLDKIDRQLASLDRLYDYASGKVKPVADRRVAGAFDALRNLNVAGKLGSAFWASFFGDKPLMDAVARLNHLPAFQRWYNEIRLLNPANAAERRLLQRQSLMLDYMQGALYRFGAIRRMLHDNGIDTAMAAAKVARLQPMMMDALADSALGRAELLNPVGNGPHAYGPAVAPQYGRPRRCRVHQRSRHAVRGFGAAELQPLHRHRLGHTGVCRRRRRRALDPAGIRSSRPASVVSRAAGAPPDRDRPLAPGQRRQGRAAVRDHPHPRADELRVLGAQRVTRVPLLHA